MFEIIISVEPKLLSLIPEQFKIQDMCDYAINKFHCTLASVPNSFKTQQICENVVIEETFIIEYVPDCYYTNKCVNKMFLEIFMR